MQKAVFLSACGDPFIASLAIRLWKERWYDEIDTFYVSYNNHVGVPISVAQEFVQRVVADPKVHLLYHPKGIGNGLPITEMTLIAREELVMLLEDDGYIFQPRYVKGCFDLIEQGEVDAIGSPRGSCGQEVTDAAIKKYGIDISGVGDKGVNYWPNFFFCKKKDLLATDLHMGSKKFGKGEYVKELDHMFREDNYGDTFVWADIQMRHNGVRFGEVPQYHAAPEEIEYYEKKMEKWQKQTMGWIHAGSLSSGWGGYLSGRLPDVSTDGAKQEIESRVSFWTIAMETTSGFEDFKIDYRNGIDELVIGAKLSQVRINKKINIYRQLLGI